MFVPGKILNPSIFSRYS